MKKSKCFFCENDATHSDVVLNNKDFIVADVCLNHFSVSLSS